MSWETVEDDQGRTYYYNSETQETSWTNPESEGSAWKVYQHDDGREYYYNEETQETTWEIPDELKQQEGAEAAAEEPERAQEDVAAGSAADAGAVPSASGEHEPPQDGGQASGADTGAGGDSAATAGSNGSSAGESTGERSAQTASAVDAALRGQPLDKSALIDPPSFGSPVEAQTAFKNLLRASNVDSTWPFQRVISVHITDPVYWSIADSLERKHLYDEYLIERIKEELTNKTSVLEKFEDNFVQVLTGYRDQGVLKHNTRWSSIKKRLIQEDNPVYKHAILSDQEIEHTYSKFIAALAREHAAGVDAKKQQALKELEAYLVEINPALVAESNASSSGGSGTSGGSSSGWEALYARLLADSRFKANRHFDSLHALDILKLYREKIYPTLVREVEQEIRQTEAVNLRSDRKARQQFKSLLAQLPKLNSNALFKEVFPLLENEDSFLEICGRNGSTPLELFWDIVDEKYQTMKLKKDIIESELRRRSDEIDYIELIQSDTQTFLGVFARVLKTNLSGNEVISKLEDAEVEEIFESLQRDLRYQTEVYEDSREKAVRACSSWIVGDYLKGGEEAVIVIVKQPPAAAAADSEAAATADAPAAAATAAAGKITVLQNDKNAFSFAGGLDDASTLESFVAQAANTHAYKHLHKLVSGNVPRSQIEREYREAVKESIRRIPALLKEQLEQQLHHQQLHQQSKSEGTRKRAYEDAAEDDDDRARKIAKPALLNY